MLKEIFYFPLSPTNNEFDKDQNHLMTKLLRLYLMIFVECLYHELILVLQKKIFLEKKNFFFFKYLIVLL